MKKVELSKKEFFHVIMYIEDCLGELEAKVDENISNGCQDDNYELFGEIEILERRYKEVCKIHDEWEE